MRCGQISGTGPDSWKCWLAGSLQPVGVVLLPVVQSLPQAAENMFHSRRLNFGVEGGIPLQLGPQNSCWCGNGVGPRGRSRVWICLEKGLELQVGEVGLKCSMHLPCLALSSPVAREGSHGEELTPF